MQRIQDDRNGVIVQKFVIAAEFGSQDPRQVGVEASNTKEDARLRIQNSDFSLFRGGLAFARVFLQE